MAHAPNTPSETQILKSIRDYLNLRGIFHFRVNRGAVIGEYKGKKRFVQFCDMPGCADLIGILPFGIFFAVEIKAAKGRQTLDQKAFQMAVEKNGGVYLLTRSLNDVIGIVEWIWFKRLAERHGI